MPKTILITGATGNISSGIIAQLKGSGHRLRALVRNPEKAEELRRQGIEMLLVPKLQIGDVVLEACTELVEGLCFLSRLWKAGASEPGFPTRRLGTSESLYYKESKACFGYFGFIATQALDSAVKSRRARPP